MRNRILIVLSLLSIILSQGSIDAENIKLLNTIDSVKVKTFDIVGDRLYAVIPGTANSADGAARLSIVNLTTGAVIAEGEDGSPGGGIRGYPDYVVVFGNVAVVEGSGPNRNLYFFDVSGDNISFLGDDLIKTSFISHSMHLYKRGNYLYVIEGSTGFGVYDMTDPLNPVILHEKDYGSATDYPYSIYANENYIFVSEINSKVIYIHNNGGSYDKIGTISSPAWTNAPHRVASYGNLLYTDSRTVHNISDPTNPINLSDENFAGSGANGQMVIHGDYLYFAGGDKNSNPRAWIYNIKDYTDVKTVQTYESGSGITGNSYSVSVVNNKVYFSFSGTSALNNLYGSINVYGDNTPPTISSVSLSSDNTTLSVTMSETVYNTNSGSGSLEASDFSFSIDGGGIATLSSATPTSISAVGNVYTLGIPLSGTPNGFETLTVNPVANSIYDGSGTVASTDQSNNSVKLNDNTSPTILSTLLAFDHSNILVTFNELVYNATGGSGALEVSDFTLSSTGGVATVAALPSSILIENQYITLGLNITGTPDGSETLVVVPSSETAIYDASGNAASKIQSNNSVLLYDKAPPTLTSVSSTKDNGVYGIGRTMDIDITFSETVVVTGNPQLTLETGENDVAINYNKKTGKNILSFNYVVSEGDTTSDLDYISSTALSVVDGAIKDNAGNSALLTLPDPGEENSLGANKDIVIDGVRPIIEKVTMTKRNENVEVKMSEPVFNSSLGSGEVEISDFKYELEGGTASLISFAPFTISKKDSTYTLDLQVQGYANGAEKLTVKPVEKSIYDFAGNEMKTLQDSNIVNLLESIPPMITDVTLAADNSTIDVTLSETAFSSDSASGELDINDFSFTISGGVATLVANNPSTITVSDKTFTLGISLSTLADGNENLTVNPVDDSIYDALGNESLTKQSNNVVRLNDFVAPVITNVVGVETNTINPTENAFIQLVISEQLASAKVDVVSKLGDSIINSYSIQKDRINITLEAGFVSGDSIEITADALTDLSNNIGIKNIYKYYVSILGDFNNDSSVDISDLNNFVSAWKVKSLAYELGPVTGTAPHFKPNVDGVFNARDGMAFYRMWHWDYGRVGKLSVKIGPQVGQALNRRVKRDKLIIQPPKGTNATELIVNYLPNEIQIEPTSMNRQTDIPISLAKQDTISGQLIINQIHSSNESVVLDLNDIRVDQALVQISYRYFNTDSQLIGSGYEEILLSTVPEEFALHQNYPNPFNPITTIQYDVPYQSAIKLVIYDILGREVVQLVNKTLDVGYHTTMWNGQDHLGLPVSAGIYFFQIQSNDFVKTQKMILLK